MFQLTADEFTALRSQFATLKSERGQHRKYLPYAFTEHGAIMAAAILNSPQATEISVYIVRAFVKMRELIASNKELSLRMEELEQKVEMMVLKNSSFEHSTRKQIKQMLDAIHELMAPPTPSKKRPIGFVTPDDTSSNFQKIDDRKLS